MAQHLARNVRTFAALAKFLTIAVFATSCTRPDSGRHQGYVEGEFVYVASPLAGELEKLAVQRGGHVKPGDLLFELECGSEKAERDGAERRPAPARATLAHAQEGRRPSHIALLEAPIG